MAALLTGIIAASNLELVRDKLGEILALELHNQSILPDSTDADPAVYIGRIVPFQPNEFPAVNVRFMSGRLLAEDVRSSDWEYTYQIEYYAKRKYRIDPDDTTRKLRGDTLAEIAVHRGLMQCRAILKDNRYRTLGWARPSIGGVSVSSITGIQHLGDDQDTATCMGGALEVKVKVPETVELIEGTRIALHDTQLMLAETEAGMRWVWSITTNVFADGGTSFTIPEAYSSLTLAAVNDGQNEYNYSCFTREGDVVTMTNGANFPPGTRLTLIFEHSDYITMVTVAEAGKTVTLPAALASATVALINDGQQTYTADNFTKTGTSLVMTNDTTFPAGAKVLVYHGINCVEITASAGAAFALPEAWLGEEVAILYDGNQPYSDSNYTQDGTGGSMTNGTTFYDGQKLTLLFR